MLLIVELKYSTVQLVVKNTAEAFNVMNKYKKDGWEIVGYEIK